MTARREEEAPQASSSTREPRAIEAFLGDPTREIDDWIWLWENDAQFPIRSHRPGLLGRALVAFKRLFRPLVKTPQSELWERQRIFNLVLLERLGPREARIDEIETFLKEGLDELMRYSDALYARVDQKLDRYRREADELSATLKSALASGEPARGAGEALEALDYRRLEDRYRGTPEEIAARVERYLPWLAGRDVVLDLGCGRGEALEVLRQRGHEVLGVDASPEMVRLCRDKGLSVEEGDLFEALAAREPESVDAVLAFHVIEHLEPDALPRLISLARAALRPGGVLLFETPSPLSLVAGARNFWLDPTHRRPVHPDSLRLAFEQAGFVDVERVDASPFSEEVRLPEIELEGLDPAVDELADRLNRLRDRLDDLLFGFQDFAVIGRRPE